MDVDMNEFYLSESCSSSEEFDPNYEFEAPRYYDFSRTETTWEVEEAERWFHSAGTYPPSRKHSMLSLTPKQIYC